MLEESYYIDCESSLQQVDRQDLKTSFSNWDSLQTPYKVIGRKINSEALLTNNSENPHRYPLPVQINMCKPRKILKSQLQDISNRPRSQNSKPRYKSKTPEPVKNINSRPPSELKKISNQRIIGKSTAGVSISKSITKKSKISIEIPQSIKENNSITKKNINSIVMQTLKNQQKQKKKAEKSKVEEKERQKLVKKQLEELNKNTRLENYNRFKQEKFQPKYAWGIDERRITRVNDPKMLKEAEELRKKKREERERSKSAGRGRIGLDVLKLKREHSKMIEEELPQKKPGKEKDKSILIYMKKQKKLRQKSKELQQEKIREEENKRLNQLLELEKITKKRSSRHKSSKISRKKYSKKEVSVDDSNDNYSEDEEVMEILHGVRSITPDNYEIRPQIHSFDFKQSGRECQVFGVFPESVQIEKKGNITQLVNDIVEKRVKENEDEEEYLPLASSTLPMADVKASYSVVNTEEEYKESSSSDISKRKSEIRKKLAELRNRVDRAKDFKSEDFDDKRNKAAVKIQALVRGVLTRQALRRYFEEIDNDNPQESEDYEWMFEKKYADTDQNSSYYEEYQISNGKHPHYSNSEVKNENKNFEKAIKKQQEVERILQSQVEWRDIQKSKLVVLKNKDLEEMKVIAKKVGSEDVLMKHFEEIIERRYAHINQLFDENIEAVKSAVQQAIEDDNTESLLHTLEKQENFASEIFQNLGSNEELNELIKLKHDFDFKNIWNYTESSEQSVRISELDLNSASERTVEIVHRDSPEPLALQSQRPSKNVALGLPHPNLEPIPAVSAVDVVETMTDIVGHEAYIEACEEAWSLILTSSSFINDVAERVFKMIVLEESEKLHHYDFHFLLKKNEHSPVKPHTDVPILDLKPAEKPGIEMDENYILQYIRKLFDYLSQINFNIESILNVPNSLEPLEMLSKMQEAEIGVMIEKTKNTRVLPLHLYLNLEKEGNETNQVQEAQHIHNKMLFDVLNEALLNRSLPPLPLPWSFDNRKVSHKYVQIPSILGEIIEEVKELNKVRAGKVPKIEFISNSEDTEEDIIQQIREEQLSCMLAMEIIAQEPFWINYEFEETQVKLDLSDMTLEGLVEEMIAILDN